MQLRRKFRLGNDLPERKNILKVADEVGCDVPEDLNVEMFAYFDNNLIVLENFWTVKL